jgi:hypothetical protein
MAEVDRRKAELIAELEVSRGEMRTAMRRVERSADVVERIRCHIGHNLGGWILGGLASGLVLARFILPRSRTADASPNPEPDQENRPPGPSNKEASSPTWARNARGRGGSFTCSESEQTSEPFPRTALEEQRGTALWISAARFAFDLAKPKLMEWASVKLNEWLSSALEQTKKAPPTSSPSGRGDATSASGTQPQSTP